MGEKEENISDHMRHFGLHVIAEGIKDSVTAPMLQPYLHSIALAQVAHGTEIVLKARIAQEHPLLIFEKIPRQTSINDDQLSITHLLEKGRTIGFFELPDRLWAVTGYKINDLKRYVEFGRLRNQIIHFAVNNQDSFSDLTLKFAFEVIEPAIFNFWGESLLQYVEGDEVEYVEERLNELGIKYIPDKLDSNT